MKKGKDWRTIVVIIITIIDIAYQLIPVDFIPDAIPVLGQIDDSIGVIINLLVAVRLQTTKYRKALEDKN